MWVLAVILIVALLIPVAAILVDSPLGKSVARRMEARTDGAAEGTPPAELRDMQRKVELLETELEDLNRSVTGMREELQFMQRLLEDPRRKKPTS
jgi:HAMP domain-containing protein